MRECLIDGNVKGDTLSEFLKNRQAFLQTAFGASEQEFKEKVTEEINRILSISPSAAVHLWFEEDLFCQTNFWFSIHLLHAHTSITNLYLILPTSTLQYGFGGMNHAALETAYQNKYELQPQEIHGLHTLWLSYQQNQPDTMMEIANNLSPTLPFLLPAVKAHINRLPDATGLGYPERLILALQQDLRTTDFPTIFKAFHKQAAIYGFGDLQVRRIWERVNSGV